MNVGRPGDAKRRRQQRGRRSQLLLAVVKRLGQRAALANSRRAISPSAIPEVLVPITTANRSAPKRSMASSTAGLIWLNAAKAS